MLELRLTPSAETDLEHIWRYSAETWGPDQADRYIDGLVETFAALREMPGMARERVEFTPPVRVHPSGRHVVIYLVEGQAVVVIRVLGGRQDWGAALRILDE